MSDFMTRFYLGFLQPYVESCPKTDGETLRFSLLDGTMSPQQREDLQTVLAFYAVHAFRLGAQLGLSLREERPGAL